MTLWFDAADGWERTQVTPTEQMQASHWGKVSVTIVPPRSGEGQSRPLRSEVRLNHSLLVGFNVKFLQMSSFYRYCMSFVLLYSIIRHSVWFVQAVGRCWGKLGSELSENNMHRKLTSIKIRPTPFLCILGTTLFPSSRLIRMMYEWRESEYTAYMWKIGSKAKQTSNIGRFAPSRWCFCL